jgi:TetR/AcrR family transcriptional regulator, mexCD-oprJ operon repressor
MAGGAKQAIADRNIEAILDAATDLLQDGPAVSMSAVAKHAGLSRVTVYAHFPTWEALLEAATERAVTDTIAALRSARPDDGPPPEALDRMIAASWQHLARYGAMAQAVAERLTPEAVTRTHHAAHQLIAGLLHRGQADGSFRTELPDVWLTTAAIALIHACAAEVRAGRIPEPDAAEILSASIGSLFTGCR